MKLRLLKGLGVGAGYFSQFHYEAWNRIPFVSMAAVCDADLERAQLTASNYGIPHFSANLDAALSRVCPDFVDLITPPATHFPLIRQVVAAGVKNIICQKPLAPSLAEAEEIVQFAQEQGCRLLIHENFRFQPWHRTLKNLLEQERIGTLFSMQFRMRMGDGWPDDAYLDRQPYFRTMPRLLIYETGIHFIDTFRFLAGEITSVFAQLRRLNPAIAGEDAGMVWFQFANGAQGFLDANRYNEPNYPNPRYTFGEFLLEGSLGSLRLYPDGRITLQKLGFGEREYKYVHESKGFAGDCVFFTQQEMANAILKGQPYANEAAAYLLNVKVLEAVYRSNELGQVVLL